MGGGAGTQISRHHGVQPDRRGDRFHGAYRQQAEKFGYEISGDQLGWSTPTYVAETDEIAERESAAHMEALFNNFFHIPPELLFPPGYTSIRSLQAMLELRKGLADARVTFKDLMTRGNVIVGSPATVREKIEASTPRPASGSWCR